MTRLNTKVTARFLKVYASATFRHLYVILLGNVYGTLALCFIFYFLTKPIFGVSPLTPQELLLWVADQNAGVKTALLASLVATVGLLVAYSTALSAIKAQQRTTIRINAADELGAIASDLSKELGACKTYIDGVIDTVEKSKKSTDKMEIHSLANFYTKKSQNFLESRDKILLLGYQLTRWRTKHLPIWITQYEIRPHIDDAIDSLQAVIQLLGVPVPLSMDGSEISAQSFVSLVDLPKFVELSNMLTLSGTTIANRAAYIRSALLRNVIGRNLSSLYALYKERRLLWTAVTEHQHFIEQRRTRRRDKKGAS